MISRTDFEFGNALLDSAASLVQLWVQRCCSSSVILSEDQVCENTGYDRMFGDIAFAVLSDLGRSSAHPESWPHLSFRGH